MSEDCISVMRRTALRLLLLAGLSIVWIAGNAYWEEYRYLRCDWLLLTVIEERAQHKTQAGYAFLLGAGGPGPDRSMADFSWCIMAAQRGWSIEETTNKLMEVAAKPRNARGCVTKATRSSPRRTPRRRQRAADRRVGARPILGKRCRMGCTPPG